MSPLPVVRPAMTATSRVLRRARASSALLPALRRKPRIAARWILTAWTAHATLAAVILLLTLAHPHARDAFLDAVAPREKLGEKIAGAFGGTSRADTFRRRGALALDALAGACGGGAFLVMLFAHLPVASARARAESERLEREADSAREHSPLSSAQLYRSALDLTHDAAREAAIASKIAAVDRAVATGRDAQPTVRELSSSAEDVAPDTGAKPAASATPGSDRPVAGRYALAQRIGRGAYGVVFRAEDAVLHRHVALKQIPLADEDGAAARFQREARVLAMLSHPNIVQVFDLVEEDGYLWMAMELVERGDLAAHLKRAGPLPVAAAAFLGARIADALGYAHERGVIHRDLKPLNILMADERTPKVTDFGLAKLAVGTVHTVEGSVMGSPHYMSPEQADGRTVDHRTDIYALGIILHQMVAGAVPFQGEIASVLAQHIRRPAPPLSSRATRDPVPERLDVLVARMLAKSPDDRPAQMAGVAAELTALAADGVEPAPPALRA